MLAFLHRLSCAGLAGAQLFFASVAAQQAFPRAVAALPRDDPRRHAAADLVGAMLLRLDAATVVLCSVAVACALFGRLRRGAAVLPVFAGACALSSMLLVTPAIRALREAGQTSGGRFGALHGLSSALLLAEMVLLCAAVWQSRSALPID